MLDSLKEKRLQMDEGGLQGKCIFIKEVQIKNGSPFSRNS